MKIDLTQEERDYLQFVVMSDLETIESAGILEWTVEKVLAKQILLKLSKR